MIRWLLIVLIVSRSYGRIAVKLDEVHSVSDNEIDIEDPKLKNPNLALNRTAAVNETDDNVVTEDDAGENNGLALLLSPYIKEGRLEEARTASQVDPAVFLGFKSHAGFFTVNKTYNSNTFFWYFPVEGKPVETTPWIIWLQGGPGASSLIGIFAEIGPFYLEQKDDFTVELRKRPYTWLQNHSLVFIDNPVGSGFSFTDDFRGYPTDMDTYSKHLYSCVEQFLRVFPELRAAPLYVAGESYGGKYAPSLALELHDHKADLNVNLQGVMLGNAIVDTGLLTQSQVSDPFINFGLLVPEQVALMQPVLDSFHNMIATNNSNYAKKLWTSVMSIILHTTSQQHAYNFLKEEPISMTSLTALFNKSDVRKALHVGDLEFDIVNLKTNELLASEFLSSAKEKCESLLEHYRVLIYCGHLDTMLSCKATSENFRTWNWSGLHEFTNATREAFWLNGNLAGYHKTGGRFTEVVIRGAGHMSPMDQPEPTRDLITRFTHHLPISTGRDKPKEIPDSHKPDQIENDINIINNILDEDEAKEVGQTLLLTPYIKDGQLEIARNLSEVDPTLFMGRKSHSGFLTVNETDSHIFFWYFPVSVAKANDTPWIIWLNDGQSMPGVFEKIGPFSVDERGVLNDNPETWLRDHSLLFIDSPVRSGYSITEDADYITNMDTYSKHLYSCVEQFLRVFPELRAAPLYVAGESYGGKYAPSLALELHDHKIKGNIEVNLQGVIVGNPFVDPKILINMHLPYYNYGLIDPEQVAELMPNLKVLEEDIMANRSNAAEIKSAEILQKLLTLTHRDHPHHLLRDKIQTGSFVHFLRRSEVKRALHVGDLSFEHHTIHRDHLKRDFLSSSQNTFETLLEHYYILSYCGQLDLLVPCEALARIYRSWSWPGRFMFLEALRQKLDHHDSVAGWHKTGGHLTEVVILGAGNAVTLDKPDVLHSLVSTWIRDRNIPGRTYPILIRSNISASDAHNNITMIPYL